MPGAASMQIYNGTLVRTTVGAYIPHRPRGASIVPAPKTQAVTRVTVSTAAVKLTLG